MCMGSSKDVDSSIVAEVRKDFLVLETEFGMNFVGIRSVDDGPQDKGAVATYSNDKACIEIGWSELELSIAVVIRLKTDRVPRKQRSLYLEPFIEFVTAGKCTPVVPQIYYAMTANAIKKALKQRREVFHNGLHEVLMAVAERLHHYLNDVLDAKSDLINKYHQWFETGGGHSKAGIL